MPLRTEVVVVGAGFAGAILARVLSRLGREVVLIERGRHPRFALGESSTPLADLALERLAARYGLPDLHELAAHGRWVESFPHLRRGLKRGFSFYAHRPGEVYTNPPGNGARLLVAASPDEATADNHWLRSDIDAHLVGQAVAAGVDYRDETALEAIDLGPGGAHLRGTSRGRRLTVDCQLVVDASGPGGFLAHRLAFPAALPLHDRLDTRLLYGHFDGVADFADVAAQAGVVLPEGPYPDDRAAVHHLLEAGWMYVLPFDPPVGSSAAGRRVSAGFVLSNRVPDAALGIPEGADPEEAWVRLLDRYPTLAAQFGGARTVHRPTWVPRLQHRLKPAAGERWLLLPHALAFSGPLFSTGIAWSLLAVERVARRFEAAGPRQPVPATGWEGYASLLEREADQIEALVEGAWRAMVDFRLFTAYSHLYFATVSWAETRQRLFREERDWPWDGFLGCDDPVLAPLPAAAAARLKDGPRMSEEARRAFEGWVSAAIAPRNVAGLADPERRNLYPADLETLVERSALLGTSRAEIRALLPRLRGLQPA